MSKRCSSFALLSAPRLQALFDRAAITVQNAFNIASSNVDIPRGEIVVSRAPSTIGVKY